MATELFLKQIEDGFADPVYVLKYTDSFFYYETTKLIKNYCKSKDFDVQIYDLDSKDDKVNIADIVDELNGELLFCPRKCLILRNFQKIKKKELERLTLYCKKPSQSSVLFIFTAIASKNTYPPPAPAPSIAPAHEITLDLKLKKDVPQWISNRAKQKGIRLSKDATEYLIELCEIDGLTAIDNQLEKLSLTGIKDITNETIDDVFFGSSGANAFTVSDALLKGNINNALDAFEQIKDDDSTMFFGALNSQITRRSSSFDNNRLALCYEILLDTMIKTRTANKNYPLELMLVKLHKALHSKEKE
ncbi:DNA polymerase III subunit delta [Candidatus Magnetoovum chiemensis]|nr:DNA polymerase III subunit delta [Candidatus Magnetoovum chiemensis]